MKILLVENNKKLALSIAKHLKAEFFTVDHAYDGLECETLAHISSYDIILLDIGLPLQDGWTTCKNMRKKGITIPVLMLTAYGEISDKVKGFECGADDYLTKPFHIEELIARIHALMRRPHPFKSPTIEYSGVAFDPAAHRVTRNGKEITLNAKEFSLLDLLLRTPEKIVTRDKIMDTVWDMNADPRSNVIDALVKQLRSKIDKGFDVELIHTVRGFGYTISNRGN